MCKYECNDQTYLVNKTILPPNETCFTITGLAPGSQCDFTLKAVYNPANINDDGIHESYMTLPTSKQLIFLCSAKASVNLCSTRVSR